MRPYTVSYKLQRLGFKGTDAIVTLAERGFVTELRCMMLTCYCPGGRGFFERKGTRPDKWTATQDHFPVTREKGGHLVPENVRLAHKRCNGLDSGATRGHERRRESARAERDKWLADHRGSVSAAELLWVKRSRGAHPEGAPDF